MQSEFLSGLVFTQSGTYENNTRSLTFVVVFQPVYFQLTDTPQSVGFSIQLRMYIHTSQLYTPSRMTNTQTYIHGPLYTELTKTSPISIRLKRGIGEKRKQPRTLKGTRKTTRLRQASSKKFLQLLTAGIIYLLALPAWSVQLRVKSFWIIEIGKNVRLTNYTYVRTYAGGLETEKN